MYNRLLSLKPYLSSTSLFLFGPRQTGKTTLVRQEFPAARYYSLNELDTFRELSSRPEIIRRSLNQKDLLVIIDEIQKLPLLLNEVQAMMDINPKLRFILTGSSARSLRRSGVNLLGGRALIVNLYPLTSAETEIDLFNRRLRFGSLPAILNSEAPEQLLRAYVGTYLHEEIRAEGLVRSVETFSRFLDIAALANGEQINFTEVGSDAGVPPRTVREHFQILEDTLIGSKLPPYRRTKKRKPVATSKFYLFDVGIANLLLKRTHIEQGSKEYGQVLEHQIYLELRAYLGYSQSQSPLTYWRTHTQHEVDFIIGDTIAIEVKATSRIDNRDLKSMRYLTEEVSLERKIIVCQERTRWKTDDGIEIIPIQDFLKELWDGALLS